MEATDKENDIKFVIECLNSDLYSYGEYVDDMIEMEGSVYTFLSKYSSSLFDWLQWFRE